MSLDHSGVLVGFRCKGPSWVWWSHEVLCWEVAPHVLWCWLWMLRCLVGALVLYGALGKPVQEVGQEGVLLAPTSELSHLLGGSRALLPAKGRDIPVP